MKKLLTFFLTALLAFGVGWAETATVTASKVTSSSVTWTGSGGESWNVSVNGGATNQNVVNDYAQIGTKNSPSTSVTFSTSGISGTITSIVVNCASYSGLATLSATVGGSSFGTQNQATPSWSSNTGGDVTFTGSATGNIVITMTNGSSGRAMYIKSITVTYTPGGTPSGPKYYHKVTSNDELVEGNKYIIVYESGNKFLGAVTTSTTGNGAAVSGPTISGRQVDINGYSDITEWTLESLSGTENRNFMLNNGDGYLAFNSGSTDNLCLKSSTSNYTRWRALYDNAGGCTLNNSGSTSRYIQYNSSGSNFTCASTYANAYLYVEGEAPALPTAEAPTFDPVSGTEFYGSQTVTITSATNGATIYYTLDGSTPTTSSSRVANGGTVTISSSCTIKAIAVAQGYDNSSVAEATYTKATVPMPTFSTNGGTFDIGTSVEVTITAITGASIYYTLDGTDPVASRTAYTGPITISETTTLKAIAVYNGETSEVATAQFNFAAPGSTCDATISFRSKGDDSPNITSSLSSYIEAGSGYLTSISGTNVYSTTEKGIRLGTSGNPGSVTLNLAAQTDGWKVTSVVLNAAQYGSDTGSIKVTTDQDGTGSTIQPSGNDLANYTFALNNTGTDASWIKIETTSKRAYIKSITIYYECTPIPSLTALPNPLNINDTNETGGKTGTIYVSGENLGNDNVGVTNYDSNHSTNFSSNPGYFVHNGTVTNYPVAITYNGHALSATGIVYPANNLASTSVNINYLYRGPIYVVGNVNDKSWQTVDGVQMTRDENTGQYSVVVNAYNNGNGNAYLYFTKSISGNSYDDLGDNRFSARCNDNQGQPVSTGNWGLTSSTTSVFCDLDTVGYLHTIEMAPGNYKITIDPATNKFMIEPFVLNITFSPEDGTHFTGESISGTITSNHADATIEWSTDGTNWQSYSDGFTATVAAPGQSVTVYARATGNGVTTTAQATYTRDAAPAPAAPSFSIGSSAVPAGTVVTITAPAGCTLYVDGQQVTSPYDVTITHSSSISAYCVNDEGTQSAIVTNTYTIATVCNAEVVFKDNGSDASSATSWAHIGGEGDDNYFDAGRAYISGADPMTRIYKATTGLKFGTSSLGGTVTFNLADNIDWKVSHITLNAKAYNDNYYSEVTVTTSDGQTKSTTMTSSTLNGYTLDFNGSAITSITITTDARIYLKGFTITYDCAPEVEAPVLTPATGTYYENQSVHMSAGEGCRIYYTTNGSDPTTSSPEFTDDFIVSYNAGSTTTIKAIAVDGDGVISDVTTVVYTWAAPSVHIPPDSRNTTASSMSVTLTPDPAGAQVYYTTDGSTPSPANGTLYTGPFTVSIPNVGDAVTVKAIAVMGNTSAVATATYTHVESVLDVNVPFFSPLKDHTYYGDQTLQIGCTTPNADIYYEIVEVSGTTAPSASDVEDPTHVSTHYDGSTIEMTVGNSYYVKAIAYIGNNPSTIAEGWYTILEAPTTQYTYTNLKDFNDHCPTGVTATFLNPVQVVYHSTYTNNGQFAEFCYLRDNTDYACVYFGKRDTSGKTIFNMGDWIDGSQISGLTNIWDRNFHIQLGTNAHTVYTWPTQAIGWSEIIPEEMTCDVIVAGTSEGDNVWGHYVHLRNTRLSNVDDYSATDPKHTGLINDGTANAYYYDKFYRWSAGTCSYTTGGTTYSDPINCLGDYDQAFFTAKQNAGATFDVYGVVDYYSQYTPPFEMCPIDFLWAYKPQMTPATTTSFEPVTVDITATQPEWAAEGVVIYYKTEDMEEWAVYTGPITVNSTTTIQAYAEVPAEKTDGTNYNDYVRSEILTETYTIEGIVDPTISPVSQVIEVTTGQESLTVTVTDHNEAGSGAVTTYTVNGVEYTLEAGQSVEIVVTETTTVTAVSSIVSGENTLYSNEVSETYDFITPNGKTYDLLTTNPVVGNIYVIVNKADKVGLSTTQNANNRAGIGVTFTNNNKTVVNGNASLAEFILESANAGRYYFRQVGTQNYLCVTTNEYANLMTGSADVNAEAAATVNSSVTSGVDQSYPATITFYYDGTPRYLRYYSNNRTFTTYGDATANQDIFLYGIEAPELLPPTIDPMSHTVPDGTILNGTVTPDEENPEGALTWYTTDGSDPRTSSTRILWTEDNNGEFTITETTTVKAVTGYEFGDGYIYSDVVSETYTFVFATTLAWIEREGVVETEYIVANELVGAWAVNNPQDGSKLLWAKDQGNVSIDKRPAKTDDQMDYVKDILQYEWQETWDESNWVILNFANIDADPEDYVGHRITAGTVDGVYTNDGNYEIRLNEAPGLVNDNPQVKDMPLYTGWVEPFPESKLGKNYDLAYNSFVPANFMTENHNHEVNGEVVGFIAGEGALGNLQGDELYFVNPKIQEVAHIWAVWNGNNIFTVYQAEHQENQNINAWNLNGTFRVNWDYNCKSKDSGINGYGEPTALVQGVAYEFHAAIMHPTTNGLRGEVAPQGTPNPGTPSNAYMLYPLDVKDSGTPTAIVEISANRVAVGVMYYNLVGQQSSKPFEGINIVVTRYSDGSTSAVKVLY